MKWSKTRLKQSERLYRNYYKTAWGIRPPRDKRASSKRSVVISGVVVLVMLALLALPRISHATLRVDVFTTSKIAITGTDKPGLCVDVYQLDSVQNIEKRIDGQLHGLVGRMAEHVAKAILAQGHLNRAFKGLMLAKHYGIKRLPTIVINDKAAVVGQTDVNVAIREYQAWHK